MIARRFVALSLCGVLSATGVALAANPAGAVNMAELVDASGKSDASDAIQRVIDSHPNRTLWFPDGTYLLSKPICTPAHPRKSVDLQLSNYAVFKAAPGWTNVEAMVRLGGVSPANDINTPGSVYSLTGGIIDGSGVAKGVSIDSGRETRLRLVSMKNVLVGIHIKRGANNWSSDADISDVHIVGNGASNSVGVLIVANDNTLSNMRIARVNTGVKLLGSGNLMTNIHPLFTGAAGRYGDTVGFADFGNNNSYNRCYSDHFSTGWFFGARSAIAYMDGCICYWYAKTPGERQTAIRCEKRYNALSSKMWIGFKGKENQTNTVICAGEKGGVGILEDPRLNEKMVNEKDRAYLDYLRGGVH